MKLFESITVPPGWPNSLMKKLLALTLVCATGLTASAQLFRPEVTSGALLGGLAGAVIGHNDGRHGWEGAAYGALAGAVIGSIVGEANDQRWHGHTQVRRPVIYRDSGYRSPFYAHYGYGYHGYRPHSHWSYGYRSGSYYHSPRYSSYYPRSHYPRYYRDYGYGHVSYYGGSGDRIVGGSLLGAGIGAIIGHNNGRRGWEGAAYGALAGAVIGSITDRGDYSSRPYRRVVGARYYEQPEIVYAPPQTAPQAAQPQQVTIINNYYAPTTTPMSSANSLFGR